MKRHIWGKHAVREAIMAGSTIHLVCFAKEHGNALDDVLSLAQRKNIALEACDASRLDGLSKGARHQGVVALAGEYSYLNVEELLSKVPIEHTLLVALDELSDPQNLGAIIRTSVCLGVGGLILPRHRSAPVTGAVVRASAGATEHAKICRVANLGKTLTDLRERSGFEIIGLDADGSMDVRHVADRQGGRVLVVGSEGRGLRRLVRRACDVVVRIGMEGPVASLNASVAAAIAIHHLKKA